MEVLATLSVKEFNSLCRFCTRKQKNLKPIFKEENDGGCFDFTNSCGDNGIVNMLSECTGLETTPTDGLPLFICTECHQKLLDSHSFRNQCIESVDKLRKIRLNFNNVKNEGDDDSSDHHNTFFADTFGDDDGWDQDESENYVDPKDGNCQIVVEPIVNTNSRTSTRKPPAKRKAPAKRKSKATAKRKIAAVEDQETTEDIKVEINAAALAESAAETSVDELKPELDPVTGEIVMPTVAVDSQVNKSNRKRDRTKGPKVKKEKKPYVRKPNKPEQCDICGFISRSLKSHMLVHTQERNFECDFCGKKFALRASLKNHIFAHINIRKFKCKICSASFNTYKVLKHHSDGHEPILKYPCDLCPRRFRHKYYLLSHRTTHSQIRKHSCQYCDQSFNTAGGLRNHIGLHNGVRSYKCGICPQTFFTSSAATIHRRQHRVGNCFKCEKCSAEIKHFTFFKMHLSTCCPEKM
ncbi:zinc finger and SCAN domain-containing protein 12-like isoform X11 [Bradysia coprophila]|uniref:zinc finger and SCAN domain-containing protein 12-like isoform X11 n=1 Tax=Bradysia coprophila TaxID=38358 RepID=UPI00187D8E1D|nr:zinc finger and SCAN domain-containing protein 12-like isoform X11 [Bradysia coprophila]